MSTAAAFWVLMLVSYERGPYAVPHFQEFYTKESCVAAAVKLQSMFRQGKKGWGDSSDLLAWECMPK